MPRARDDVTGSLFPGTSGPPRGRVGAEGEPRKDAPLADRVRPRTLDEVLGQEEVLGPGRPLRRAIEQDQLRSLILWGPPGSGKTTLAFVIRRTTRAHFEAMSAVLSGVKEVREVMRAAEERRRREGRRTIVFIDEIHRFNKAQQDALLSHVESGDIVLIGATTENPSFEVNAALLSRSRVVVLKPLGASQLLAVLKQALADRERGLATLDAEVDEGALRFLAEASDGDARTALNVLELGVTTAMPGGDGHRRVDEAAMREAFARKSLLYDRAGEEHYNIISALHKSVRNSDADAGLYWLARMLEAGEDPLYVARRLIRFASEDVGLADPLALVVAMAAQQAVHFIGMPEGALALAELVVYLAAAPKSNAVYTAYGEASREALETRAEPVPLWIRNAPTGLMKDLGYGRGYQYAHDEAEGVAGMDCLPESLAGRRYFKPTDRGREKDLAARLEAARLVRERKKHLPREG
ncbi:MAG TPA: replication-associated recombination protein A [Vicinamibacteria bacterium]|nr:replication-associated recombination protein A [Vicinamibacteria bacterium]